MSTLAERLAARMTASAEKDLTAPITQEERRAAAVGNAATAASTVKIPANSRKFSGPPGARLWFEGTAGIKRFSDTGIYITSVPSEILALSRMLGVNEIVPNVPLKK